MCLSFGTTSPVVQSVSWRWKYPATMMDHETILSVFEGLSREET